jgi:hypothetical protein
MQMWPSRLRRHVGAGRSGDAAMHEYRIPLDAHAPARSRERLAPHLERDRVDDGALAVSELVTYGIREGLFAPGDEVLLRVDDDHRDVHVEIRGSGRPTGEGPGWRSLEDSVLALVLLNSVTTFWGVLEDGRGAWFSIER